MRTILFVNKPLMYPADGPPLMASLFVETTYNIRHKINQLGESLAPDWPFKTDKSHISDDMWRAIFLNVKDDLMIDHNKYKLSHDLSLGQSLMYAARHPTVNSGKKVIEGTIQKVRTPIFTACLTPLPLCAFDDTQPPSPCTSVRDKFILSILFTLSVKTISTKKFSMYNFFLNFGCI